MPVSKRKQLRRCKRKFIRFKFQLRNGRKSRDFHQGLADGKAGYAKRYGHFSFVTMSMKWHRVWSDYMKGYDKGREYLL